MDNVKVTDQEALDILNDIKEYVNYKLNRCFMYDQTRSYLKEIKSMLDELIDKTDNTSKEIIKGFTVIDTKTGKYPDVEKIALKEKWAKGLIYCDMEGFAILEDGDLILADECGNFADCPLGRFKIKPIYYK